MEPGIDHVKTTANANADLQNIFQTTLENQLSSKSWYQEFADKSGDFVNVLTTGALAAMEHYNGPGGVVGKSLSLIIGTGQPILITAGISATIGGVGGRQALTQAVAGQIAGYLGGLAAAGALATVGSGVGVVIGAVVVGYLAAEATESVISNNWQTVIGPDFGRVVRPDGSIEYIVDGKISDFLTERSAFWDFLRDVNGQDVGHDVWEIDELSTKSWIVKTTETSFTVKYIQENGLNTFDFIGLSSINNFRQSYKSNEEVQAVMDQILAKHDQDFNLAVNEDAVNNDHVINMIAKYPAQLERDIMGDQATFWAAQELTPFVLLNGDKINYNNPEVNLDNFSKQYKLDRAKYLYFRFHEGEYNWGSTEGIDFKDFGIENSEAEAQGGLLGIDANYHWGTDSGELLAGWAGDNEDHLYGMGGDDTLSGHGGDDYLEGGKGQDTMDGGSGNDTFAIIGTDTAYDIFDGGAGEDKIIGSAHDDTIRVHQLGPINSIEAINGGAGENIIAGTDGNNTIDLTGITVINIGRIEGGGGVDTITGSSGADNIYGGNSGDTLRGMGGNDTLYGILRNGSDDYASDTLEGGAGNDTYHIGTGDTINDSDQQGTIWYGATQITGTLTRINENSDVYEADDYIVRLDADTGALDVFARNASFNFIIENFTSDNFGLNLAAYVAPVETYDYTLTGTALHDEMAIVDISTDQTNWKLNFTSFPEGSTSETPFFSTTLPATAPHLSVSGGGSGDFLFGFQGHDHIDGGDGSDVIMGSLGFWNGTELTMTGPLEGDLLEGGSGNDWIQGSGGDDRIFGGEDNDIIQSFDGNDYLSGDQGNDVLAGGAHDVFIEGGEGDDALFGDGYFIGSGSVTTDSVDSFGITFTYSEAGYALNYTTTNFTIRNNAPNPGNDFLFGGAGRDYLDGGAGNDVLLGGDDADSLFGGIGNDNLSGGAGTDFLSGGEGDDTYEFGRGYGRDRIYDIAGADIIRFADVNPGDLTVTRTQHDLSLAINGTEDSLSVVGWFDGNTSQIEQVNFSDGTTWDAATLESRITAAPGTSGDDVLYGGVGNDTYFFNPGGGADIIQLDPGGYDTVVMGMDYDPSSLSLFEWGSDMIMRLNDGSQFTFNDWFAAGQHPIELFTFADGTQLTGTELLTVVQIRRLTIGSAGRDRLYGYEGADAISGGIGNDSLYGYDGDDHLDGGDNNDYLFGGAGDDILIGGPGRDYLYGGLGNDLYLFAPGSGFCGISDYYDEDIDPAYYQGDTDTVRFTDGILAADLHLTWDGSSRVGLLRG